FAAASIVAGEQRQALLLLAVASSTDGFDGDHVMNPDGLRFPDECCRHKALDLIGDLALIGKPLLGHVIAERAGHAMHAALVTRIMSDPSMYEILTFDQLADKVVHALVS
ncbi:MAG: UDP-3-O-acyl-N-acetylglucosamine deacetylase, partial [Thermoguttaceae bacterium]